MAIDIDIVTSGGNFIFVKPLAKSFIGVVPMKTLTGPINSGILNTIADACIRDSRLTGMAGPIIPKSGIRWNKKVLCSYGYNH